MVEINDLDKVGVIKDIPPYQLPPEAFSLGHNVRTKEGGLERLGGHSQIFGTLPAGNDSFTKVLLHFDGTDGSTSAPENPPVGGAAHTWTAAGNAQLDTAQTKFGATSAVFDGTGDWFTTPDHVDFTLGSGDFTVDFWFRCNAASGADKYVFGQGDSTLTAASRSFAGGRVFAGGINPMFGQVQVGVTQYHIQGTTNFTDAVNSGWHHYALVRAGAVLRLFLDGVQEGGDLAISGSVNDSSNAFRIGAYGEFVTNPWNGWIDEFRLSVGVARWTTDFTPPVQPYVEAGEGEPHFAMPLATSGQTYWLWTSLEKAYVYDGVAHFNITRRSGGLDSDYSGNETRDWNGTLLGGVAILNNNTEVPQYWPSIDTQTPLANLPNWPANNIAKIIRGFGPYLMALNITKSAVNFAHMVKWSHPADPGSIPTSWDHTDPTKDAGEYDLPDAHAGVIVEGATLRDHFFIYKEGSVWRATAIGGAAIFDFDIFLEFAGALTQRCVTYTPDGGKQVFASGDDILIHNGNTAQSILDRRMRRAVFNSISTAGYRNCFMFTNPFKGEVWFCYPTGGNTQPNHALIWNYIDGQPGSFTEADVRWRNATSGTTESDNPDTWLLADTSWEDYSGPWAVTNRRKVVCCGTDYSKFFLLDSGLTFDGEPFTATAQRESLSLTGRKRNGEWIVDYASHKLVTRIWLKLEGGPVLIRVGFEEFVGESSQIAWLNEQVFDPAVRNYVDFVGSGKAVAFEIRTVDSVHWRLLGYKVEYELLSMF